MKITHSLLTLLIILAHTITLLGNPGDIKLVPFDKEQHLADAERIYHDFFSRDTSGVFTSTKSHIQIACLGNAIIGFLRYQDFEYDSKKIRYLHHIAIDASHQKKGYGTSCMKLFEQQACNDGIYGLQLDSVGNTNKFYFDLGFGLSPVNSLSMIKKISSEPGPNLDDL